MDIEASLQFLKSGGIIPYSEWDRLVRHTDLTYNNLAELRSVLEGSNLQITSIEKNALQASITRRVQAGDYSIEVREPDTGIDYGSGEEGSEDNEDGEDEED